VSIDDRLARDIGPQRLVRKPLRIAFLSYRSDPKVGGQGVFVAAAARALTLRGHRVDVISGPPYPHLDPSVGLVRLQSLDLYAQPHHGHRALRPRHLLSFTDTAEYFGHLSGAFMEPYTFGRRAAKHLGAHRDDYDVVLDNQSLCYGLDAIERAGLPIVGVIHHPIHRDLELALAAEPKWGMRLLIRRWHSFLRMQEAVAPKLRQILTVSEASRRDIIVCLGVASAAIHVVPLGVDQAVFRPYPELVRHPCRLLTTASADVPIKGLRFLIEAYSQLVAKHSHLELVVVGRLRPGPAADLIAARGLEGRVRFVSDLTRDDLAREYASATICVTPSIYEGFGLPAAEAMACATPVVVTDGGALPEVVGDAGVIVPKGDASALAAALDDLLADPERRRRLGEAGRRRAAALYAWDRFAEEYESVLQHAVDTGC
jgi:glycosyltransferase involved in cell wall biosynthesis